MNYGMGPNFGFGPQTGSQFGGFNGSNQFGPAGFAAPDFSQPGYFPAMNWGGGYGFTPPANAWMGPASMGWGLGGMRTWGGTYSPQFMSTGLPTDREIVEMIYDVMDDDLIIPFDAEINVDSDAGTVTLTGTVHSKLVKHAAGDDAWWIPGVDDVRNELRVVSPPRGKAVETRRGAAQQRQLTTPRTTRGTTPSTKGTTARSATPGTPKTAGTTSRTAPTGTTKGGETAPTGTKEKKVASSRTATTGTSTPATSGRTGTRATSGTRRTGAA